MIASDFSDFSDVRDMVEINAIEIVVNDALNPIDEFENAINMNDEMYQYLHINCLECDVFDYRRYSQQLGEWIKRIESMSRKKDEENE